MRIAPCVALVMPALPRGCLGSCCADPGGCGRQSVSLRNRRGDTLLLVLCVGKGGTTEDRSLSMRTYLYQQIYRRTQRIAFCEGNTGT